MQTQPTNSTLDPLLSPYEHQTRPTQVQLGFSRAARYGCTHKKLSFEEKEPAAGEGEAQVRVSSIAHTRGRDCTAVSHTVAMNMSVLDASMIFIGRHIVPYTRERRGERRVLNRTYLLSLWC
jgi:hypothetical protein